MQQHTKIKNKNFFFFCTPRPSYRFIFIFIQSATVQDDGWSSIRATRIYTVAYVEENIQPLFIATKAAVYTRVRVISWAIFQTHISAVACHKAERVFSLAYASSKQHTRRGYFIRIVELPRRINNFFFCSFLIYY